MTIDEIKKSQADVRETYLSQNNVGQEARASCIIAEAVYEVALQLALFRKKQRHNNGLSDNANEFIDSILGDD